MEENNKQSEEFLSQLANIAEAFIFLSPTVTNIGIELELEEDDEKKDSEMPVAEPLILGQQLNNILNELVDCLSSKPIKLDNLIFNLKRKLKSKSKINYLKNKTKFKRIEFNSKTNYKFFSVKKVIDLLT